MKLTKELLLKLKRFPFWRKIRDKNWIPMTADQIVEFFKDTEFKEIKYVKATFGDELHLFQNGTWAYVIVRLNDIFYIRRVNLPYEEWIAYTTTINFSLIAPWLIVINVWKYWIKKYGWPKFIAQLATPIIAWWLSGVIPVLIFHPTLIEENIILALWLPLMIGFTMGFFVYGIVGLTIGIVSFVFMVTLIWRILIYEEKKIYVKQLPGDYEEKKKK